MKRIFRPAGIAGLALLALAGLLNGCQPSAPEGVQSVLEGRLTVQSTIDTTGDYSGFRVMVARAQGRSVDTLAHTVTDVDGHFRTAVTAPERGIYPLIVWGREGRRRLATTELVVADTDTARLEATLPLERRPLRVRSPENDALTGYRNTMAQYQRSVLQRLKGATYDVNATAQGIRQTSSVLWNLQEIFPGTYAAQLAAVESLSLLEGWNDSLVVARVHRLAPSNPRFVEAARIARRSAARWRGQDAALTLLDSLLVRADAPSTRAGVEAVRVRAFIDSLEADAALAAAEDLRTRFPNTKWAEWADRAAYEVQHLLPGKPAPSFAVRTLRGDTLSPETLRGRPVVLEFFRPDTEDYARQLATRNALYQATRPDSVAFVSVSVEPDTVLNRAFLSNRSVEGHRVIAPGGMAGDIATAYNVGDTPVRFLIDAQGRIVGRYVGTAFLSMQEDLMRLVGTRTTADEPAAR